MKTFLANLLCVGAVLGLEAGESTPPGGRVRRPELIATVPGVPGQLGVTEEFYPIIDGATNPAVTARVVGPMLPPGYHQPVFFSHETKEALFASLDTNRNCFLGGRLFRVDPLPLEICVSPSRPLGAEAFTAQSALQFGKRAFLTEPSDATPYPVSHVPLGASADHVAAFAKGVLEGRGPGGPGVIVDFEPLIKQQMQNVPREKVLLHAYDMRQRISLYQLVDATMRPQGTNLEVSLKFNFSYEGGAVVMGSVVLDQRLNVLSMALADPKN